MENDDVVVCLGSSLNIQEYYGMVYVVRSCIAELTLSLSNTTLGMSLYRRKGALAPRTRKRLASLKSMRNIVE